MTQIVHKELAYAVTGCVFDVHNELGPGLREECYQKAMERRLALGNIPYRAKPNTRGELSHKSTQVHVFEPDLIVAEQIVLEIKAQRQGLARENTTQLLNYLKFFESRLGLLIDFAQNEAVIERFVYTPGSGVVDESYDFIRDCIPDELRPTTHAIRDSLLRLHDIHGLGYSESIWRRLVEIELRAQCIECESVVYVEPTFRQWRLPSSPITPLRVGGRVLLEILALHDTISSTAIRTMQTYARILQLPFGLIASFGRSRLVVRGVCA